MKILKIYLCLLLMLLSFSAKTQVILDSLWTVWNDETQADTNRLKSLDDIIWLNYINYSPDSAFYFANIQYDFAEKVNNKKWMAKSLNTQGSSLYYNSHYEKSMDCHQKSLKIFKSIGNKKGMASSYGNIGTIYNAQDYYNLAIENFEKSLELINEFGNKQQIGGCYNNIGVAYSGLESHDKAIEYFQKSLEIDEEIGFMIGVGNSLGNIGLIYKKQGKYEMALDYFEKNFKIIQEFENESEPRFESSWMYYLNVADIYFSKGLYENALIFLLKAKEVKQKFTSLDGLEEILELLFIVYEKLGNKEKAFDNQKLYLIIKDSLASMDGIEKEKQRQFHEQYLLEKQADSIKHADEILIQQAQTLANEEQLNSETQRRNGLVVISLLILVSLGLVFTQLKKVRKGKALVDEKQQEITDSINYAKRLQQGILVPFDLVQSWLSESFILFKPKDIVSGDFYWIEKVGDKIYFAVADCTGHGIPGAMVSIICSNALSNALYEDKITAPAKILDATREIVEKRFVRSTDNIKDGMDISLCCLNIKTKTVTWAGAMNPLWIIKKGSNKIEELKPDRQAIGFVEKPKSFTEYEVKLELNDALYLFSDGYQDQFGGKKGKKYMKGKMKKFVLSIQDQDMQTQLASFDKEFNTWKGSHEQIDDVCVMGVRIT